MDVQYANGLSLNAIMHDVLLTKWNMISIEMLLPFRFIPDSGGTVNTLHVCVSPVRAVVIFIFFTNPTMFGLFKKSIDASNI